MKPKVLIFRTAGTNCEIETEFAFKYAGAHTELSHINSIKNKKSFLEYQIICFPGGFSYGDDLGAGKIFSFELALWFRDILIEFIEKGGLVLGICNGFQVMAKAGILPDVDFIQRITLIQNSSQRFEDRWTYLKIPQNSCASGIWFKDLPSLIQLPVAHAEGRFYADSDVLKKIEENNQAALYYADSRGSLTEDYPFNPNGSCGNIAGITDKSGRVFGLMPHPERFIFRHHHPLWKEKNVFPWGLKIIENAVKYCR